MSAKHKPVYHAEPGVLPPDASDSLSETLAEPTKAPDSAKYVIGWREWLSLPELGIPAIKAKVDTGARTSSLHTHDYEFFESGGVEMVRFHLHPIRRNDAVSLECQAKILGRREVKDSGGHPEIRPFISATVRIGAFEWPVELSLTNRESMKFRMLLGRQALAGLFLVDSIGSYLMGGNLSRAYRQ